MTRLEEAEALLRELTDIEGPQPGHVMWARKVWAFLGIPEPSDTSENPDAVYDPVASDGHAGARARQIDDVSDDIDVPADMKNAGRLLIWLGWALGVIGGVLIGWGMHP